MRYLNCPRCHLTILERDPRVIASDCPRCLGKAGVRSPLFASSLPSGRLAHVARPSQPVAVAGKET